MTNPNISVLGTTVVELSEAADDTDSGRPRLRFDEAEFVFDDYLNPFAKGVFIAALSEEGAELEEAYFEIVRGLPAGLGLRAGKYRLDFGRLNSVHPHFYNFPDRPRVLEALLPGEESMNDVGVTLSHLFAAPGGIASTLSLTVVSGSTFRSEDAASEESRLGWTGRWRNFIPIGHRSAVEVGMSAGEGVSDPVGKLRTRLFGLDLKAKLWTSTNSNLTLLGEWIDRRQDRVEIGVSVEESSGGYAAIEYAWTRRTYTGLKAERLESDDDAIPREARLGFYGGSAILEESTVLRAMIERVVLQGSSAYNRYLLQAVFSMGPHKPHQF
ncbi:MAG: hypothetical protein FJY67_06655 [Calditrichaeota bacterium]|nr:hypothetical protein [Calditrichota bacterium]